MLLRQRGHMPQAHPRALRRHAGQQRDVSGQVAREQLGPERGYQVDEVRFVDDHGKETGGFDVEVFREPTHGRFTSVKRSDLAAVIYEALGGRVETLFRDSIARIDEEGGRVHVGFEHAAAREVDLVIEARGYRPRDELVYVTHGVAGRQVSRFAMRDGRTMFLFLFVFSDEYLPAQAPCTDAQKKAALQQVFGDVGWECPQILAAMEATRELYFDQVSQIRLPCWSRGRVALIGDAAACVSLLAGEGTGLAIAEAYVLAGELQRAQGDHRLAYARYEERLRPFLKDKQVAATRFASAFAPKTAAGIAVRNGVSRLLRLPYVAHLIVGRQLRDEIELPDYAL